MGCMLLQCSTSLCELCLLVKIFMQWCFIQKKCIACLKKGEYLLLNYLHYMRYYLCNANSSRSNEAVSAFG